MFKIKEEIELKELAKFGFEEYNGYYVLFGNNQYEKLIEVFETELFINVQLYEDRFYQSYVDEKCLNKLLGVLFDLTLAGIIEKVGE
ncbi:hypothetical protein IJE86_07985 [bacterium]|nr:hypothetical protein [bacterium]